MSPDCTSNVTDATNRCCASGLADRTGICCSVDSTLDAVGACCAPGMRLDAAGTCGGASRLLDVQGAGCRSGVVDARGTCCEVLGRPQLPQSDTCQYPLWAYVLCCPVHTDSSVELFEG